MQESYGNGPASHIDPVFCLLAARRLYLCHRRRILALVAVDNLPPIWDYLAHHAERIARALDVVVAVPLRGGFRRRARTDST
jgi:hypothetical protein